MKEKERLDAAEYTQTQEIKVGTTIDDTFLKLQTIHPCLNLTLAPGGRAGRADGIVIPMNAL